MENENGMASPGRPYFGRQLRQATFVIPTTGQRVKRDVTLRDPEILSSRNSSIHGDDERSLLLPGPQGHLEDSAGFWLRKWSRDGLSKTYAFVDSLDGHKVLKCSLAYLLATMGTLSVPLASVLGTHLDGNQILGNLTTWFDQNRSVGSMLQGIILAFIAFLYATVVAFASQAVSVFFASQNMIGVGHVFVLLVFCWGGLGFIAWIKQHAGHPLVNVACSLASLAVVLCVTKEGVVQKGDFSYYRISRVLKMLIMGIIITFVVNLVVWPISARKRLRESLVKTTSAYAELLVLTTSSFLSGSEEDMNHPAVIAANNRFKSVFTTLLKHLSEAKFEHYALGTERQYYIEQRLVDCAQQLSTDIGGLQSAAAVQISLLSEGGGSHQLHSHTNRIPTPHFQHNTDQMLLVAGDTVGPASSLDNHISPGKPSDLIGHDLTRFPSAQTADNIFETFIIHLGPPMRSLAYTLKEILKDLPSEYGKVDYLPRFRSSLADAIKLFDRSRKEALKLVYKSKELSMNYSLEVAADFEEVAASCGHFGSSLEDFAEHCLRYLDILDELELEISERPWGRSWRWLFLFWRKRGLDPDVSGHFEPGHEEDAVYRNETPASTQTWSSEQDRRATAAGFPYLLYPYLRFFRREDVKFAIKVGGGATFYAMFAFIPATEPYFQSWHLEWSLVSYMLVCSMNIGASNTTAWSRTYGTFFGAFLAVMVWIICDENPYALAFCGWLVSLGCFYLVVVRGQGPVGRFILLTYNLSVLYSYTLTIEHPDDDDDEWNGIDPKIFNIASDRLIAVLLGVFGGLIVTYFIWPISARHKVRTGLSLLWLRMGLVWKRGPLSILLQDQVDRPSYMDIRTETDLRAYMDKLDSLRKSAESEFRLSHPFPSQSFDVLLKSTNKMLNAFHALNVLITKDLKATKGEKAILDYTVAERKALSLRISHLLSFLASSLSLEYPLNDALPKAHNSRDRLLAKVFEFRQSTGKVEEPTEEDYELIYCYALVTRQIAKELEISGQELERLYGTLSEKVLKLQ